MTSRRSGRTRPIGSVRSCSPSVPPRKPSPAKSGQATSHAAPLPRRHTAVPSNGGGGGGWWVAGGLGGARGAEAGGGGEEETGRGPVEGRAGQDRAAQCGAAVPPCLPGSPRRPSQVRPQATPRRCHAATPPSPVMVVVVVVGGVATPPPTLLALT